MAFLHQLTHVKMSFDFLLGNLEKIRVLQIRSRAYDSPIASSDGVSGNLNDANLDSNFWPSDYRSECSKTELQ